MSKKTERCCNTCKHFDVRRTPTGRPVRECIGSCEIDSDGLLTLKIRDALKDLLPAACRHQINSFCVRTHGIDPSDGGDCPLWEKSC